MAASTPLFAKITRPVPGRNLHRTRLFRLIKRLAGTAPLIWVCGPPGCGKTTLVSTYVEARKIPALWYRVDGGDDDLASFFYYLGGAGKRAAPRMRKPLPLLTPEYLGGIREFSRFFFENLFSRLSSDGSLVFDDYHEIPAKSPLHDAFVAGLSWVPTGRTVFLVSRRGPPPSFARFRVNGRMEVIGWDQLRLTLDECRGIVRLRGKARLSEKGIRHLWDTTDGWAAGVVLLLERGRSGAPELSPLADRTPRELFDYFGSEIFGRMGRPLKKFLLTSALLPDMTAKAVESLTGQRRAPQLLSYLSGNNFFLSEHAHSEPLYRYHPLFREFLLSRAEEFLGKQETDALRRRVAEMLERSGRVEDAAERYSDIGDHESLSRLILSHAPSLLALGRNRIVEGWLRRLPERMLRKNPWLLFWLAACRMPFDPVESRSLSERAFERFFERKDPEGSFLSWSQILDNLCMCLNDFPSMGEWIDRFDEIRKRFPSYPSPQIEARVAASMLGGLYMGRVDHPDIEVWVNRASAVIRECRELPVRLQASLYLILYYLWVGDFPRARGIVESTRQWVPSSASSPQRKILFHLFEARLHCGVAKFDDSIRAVARSTELAKNSGMHLWDFFLLAEGAAASLGKGDPGSASAYLRQMTPFLESGQPLNHSFFHHLSSWNAALRGEIPLALSHEETAVALISDCGAPCGIALGRLFMARLENELGNTEKSSGHLENASRIAQGMRSHILEFQCSLVRADIAFLRGDEVSGLASLRRALSIGREKEFFHYDNWIPSFMIRLCVKALEEGLEVPYVQELIRRRKLVPESPPLEVELWPWPVAIYTLGRFGILRDGKPLPVSRKTQKRPLALLKALIAFGGRAVREEQVVDALWSESEGDMAIQSMSVALRRLRQLLGCEEAIQRREGILSLDARYCWVDAFAFERLLGSAASREGTGKEAAMRLVEKGLALYRGPFLSEDPERSWAVSMRERLRSRYLATVDRIGARLQQAGQWEEAREYYRRGIDVDNLAEEFYQSLMRCYLADGRRAEALAVFDRLEKTFFSLGVEPSPKTRNLLRSLRST